MYLRTATAVGNSRWCRAPDDGGGDAGDGGAPVVDAPAAPPESAPTVDAPAAPAPSFDPRLAYEQLSQRYGEQGQALNALYQSQLQQQEMAKQDAERWSGIQGLMKQMAGVQDKPVPEWEPQMQKLRGEMTQQMQRFFMEQKLKSDLPKLEQEAADLFAAAPTAQDKQNIRNLLVSVWSQYQDHTGRGHDSILDTVKMLNGLVSKVVESKQKTWATEWAKGKQGQQDALKGSGPTGTPPPRVPGGNGKQKPGADDGVSEDDVRQAMEAIKGMADN